MAEAAKLDRSLSKRKFTLAQKQAMKGIRDNADRGVIQERYLHLKTCWNEVKRNTQHIWRIHIQTMMIQVKLTQPGSILSKLSLRKRNKTVMNI